MKLSMANEFGKAICEVLGISPQNVASITIELKAGSLSKIQVERFASLEDETAITEVFKLTSFEPVGEPDQEQVCGMRTAPQTPVPPKSAFNNPEAFYNK